MDIKWIGSISQKPLRTDITVSDAKYATHLTLSNNVLPLYLERFRNLVMAGRVEQYNIWGQGGNKYGLEHFLRLERPKPLKGPTRLVFIRNVPSRMS